MRKPRGKPLMAIAQHQVTRLLQEWNDGDESAVGQLMPLVHDELHLLAYQHMRREGPGQILQTSALINEAYLRLVEQPQIRWHSSALDASDSG
jgi:RNA polymerase sigma-70 factor (ECF subfamily)